MPALFTRTSILPYSASAQADQFACRGFAVLQFAADNDDVGAMARKGAAYLKSKTATAARDQCNFSAQIERVTHFFKTLTTFPEHCATNQVENHQKPSTER